MISLEEILARMNGVGAIPLGGFDEQQRRKRTVNPPLPPPRPMMQQHIGDVLANAVASGQSQAPLPSPSSTMVERFPPPTISPDTPTAPPAVHVGQQSGANRNELGRKLDEYRALSDADVGNKVKRTDWGYEEQPPPPGGPSRKREALMGAIQGAVLAAQQSGGDPWATLGGLGTGAATGAISPRTMQAFTRQQELDRLQGEVGTSQKMELGQAQISETLAQADQRRMEPLLRAEQLERQRAADESAREERVLARQQRAEDIRIRQQRADEAARANRAREAKPTGTNERVVNGAIYRKDDDGVYRIAPGSPPPAPRRDIPGEKAAEKSEEKAAKGRQAANLYAKGAEYWDQAQAKRQEAANLPSDTRNRDQRVTQLLREAAGLEAKTREVQLKGDGLAAESEAAAGSAPSKGSFNLRQWKKDHPGADPSGVIQRAKDKKLRIIE